MKPQTSLTQHPESRVVVRSATRTNTPWVTMVVASGVRTGAAKPRDSKKGFGFITGTDETKDIFVHYTNIEGEGFRSLKDGESVEFDLVESDKGPQAHHVRKAQPSQQT